MAELILQGSDFKKLKSNSIILLVLPNSPFQVHVLEFNPFPSAKLVESQLLKPKQ